MSVQRTEVFVLSLSFIFSVNLRNQRLTELDQFISNDFDFLFGKIVKRRNLLRETFEALRTESWSSIADNLSLRDRHPFLALFSDTKMYS